MIFEVQIQIFGARALAHTCHGFHFQKIPGAHILIFFDENWHGASFYIKEQTQKYKFEIWLLKSTLLVFVENPPKKFKSDKGLAQIIKKKMLFDLK